MQTTAAPAAPATTPTPMEAMIATGLRGTVAVEGGSTASGVDTAGNCGVLGSNTGTGPRHHLHSSARSLICRPQSGHGLTGRNSVFEVAPECSTALIVWAGWSRAVVSIRAQRTEANLQATVGPDCRTESMILACSGGGLVAAANRLRVTPHVASRGAKTPRSRRCVQRVCAALHVNDSDSRCCTLVAAPRGQRRCDVALAVGVQRQPVPQTNLASWRVQSFLTSKTGIVQLADKLRAP